MNLLKGNQIDPNQAKLQDLAAQLGSQGQVLESYLKTGKLPPAMQASLDQAKASEKARIIAGYAQRGQPTDPRLNSALAQELNNVDTNAVAAMAKVQVDMLNAGLKETGMSMELYQMLTQLDLKQNEDLMKSIANFAAALGGGFGGAPAKAA
jgi:ABC-type phosphate transport system auxiliary subunit